MAVPISHTPYQTTPHDTLGETLNRRVIVRWEMVVFVLIFVAAVFTRFWALGDRAMSHDESLHVYYSYNLYIKGDFDHTPLMHGPILFHANALMYALFGDSDFSGRIYTALLGVGMVFSPLLFRRWLGKWGALLAVLMVLVSPLLLFYNRYIREDTPAIMASILMAWAIVMYLTGPEHLRRKPRWLYILAATMLWNLGSKETAFMYIASFGLFFTIYWVVRMLQTWQKIPGKPLFHSLMMSILVGAVMAIPMYVILDIIPLDRVFASQEDILAGIVNPAEAASFWVWTLLAFGTIFLGIFGTAAWAFRDRLSRIPWRDVAIMIVTALLVLIVLIYIEEKSHVSAANISTAAPLDPTLATAEGQVTGGLSWSFILIPWLMAGVFIPFLAYARRRGWWDWLYQFPEFDVLIVMGALTLPWLTAIFIVGSGGTPDDFAALGESLKGVAGIMPVVGAIEIGRFVIGFLCWLPLFTLATVAGLLWNWQRYIVCWLIFHSLFAFFYTTVFTNIQGLASGMVYSLQYWLEQQGERRGSQPQYYYFLIIMPMYEFLPILGTMAASLTGLHLFWNRRRATYALIDKAESLEKEKYSFATVIGEDGVEIAGQDPEIGAALRAQADHVRVRIHAHQTLDSAPVLMFISFWALTIMIALTLAGEKMPWLGTHMTYPMILITGWYFGRIVQKVDWATFKARGWILLLIFPLALGALVRIVAGYVTEEQPFRGVDQLQLSYTYNFLGAVIVAIACAWGVEWLRRRTSPLHIRQLSAVAIFGLLGLITFRSAWQAAFINYDDATEFLVYAHATPNTKTVLKLIEDFSRRTTDGMRVKFAYDNKLSWPGVWYFRHFTDAIYMGENPTLQQMDQANIVLVGEGNNNVVEPLLEDRYQRFDYKRMWWPMQDYFYLDATRVIDLFALTEDPNKPNTDSGRLRRAIFEIWWDKDYTLYGEVTNKEFAFNQWPVSENFYMYVRKDYVAQIWPYGTGDGSVTNPIDVTEVSACVANWQDYPALTTFDTTALGGALAVPVGIDVDDEGRVYVAEDQGFRISVFQNTGEFINSTGIRGTREQIGALFERPHSIRVAPDGTLYVVDTWNYLIRHFTADWQPLESWGSPLAQGINAPQEPTDGFWGPRDLAIDAAGNVYISDTGNKRVRVYDSTGVWLRDIGSGGSGEGQLDEPTGLAITGDGRLFVADTWNRRIAVFALDGTWLANYPVRAWYGEPVNRPYIAVDDVRNLLYVGDPEGGRVLVYDLQGTCVGAFGSLNADNPGPNEFSAIGGIALDNDGFVYVTDINKGRLLKFKPFDAIIPAADLNDGVDSPGGNVIPLEIPPDTTAEQPEE